MEEKTSLTENSLTFGKFKGLTLNEMLRDRAYCKWLLCQDWFEKQYPYLYNRVTDYSPREFFLTTETLSIEDNLDLSVDEFFISYEWFNLVSLDELEISLTETEKTCYAFYLEMIEMLKNKILKRFEDGESNVFDIKAPTGWLKRFEKDKGLPRETLKEFLEAYELRTISHVVENIKQMGGLQYNGRKAFLIAKANSLKQEAWWEEKLKAKYGEDIGTQFSFKGCQFDAICIRKKILYEMKLGLKDYDEKQHKKYLATLGTSYIMVFLIGLDAIVNLKDAKIYTTNLGKYYAYILGIPGKKKTLLDEIIENFEVVEISTEEKLLEFL